MLFAERFGISLADKEKLLAAITDPAKQFEFMFYEMLLRFPEYVWNDQIPGLSVGESARIMAQKIASEFERCELCGCPECAGSSEMIARGNLAAEMIINGTHYES